jgi:phosphoadenosine phosphosulfate reductase
MLANATLADRASALNRLYSGVDATQIIRATLAAFPGQVAMVSSFGADSAVLLHLLSELDCGTPVLMIDTEMLFPETLQYQRDLADRLGLRNVQHVRAAANTLAATDPDGALHQSDPDACCDIRKVAPLNAARALFPVIFNGRKRHQASTRAALDVFENDPYGLRVSPLVDWSAAKLQAHRIAYDLPPHPLVAQGFKSIGCAPCTSAVAEGEDARAGRWRGQDKIECGIHFDADGAVRRAG